MHGNISQEPFLYGNLQEFMLQHGTTAHIFCEPAQSRCTSTCHMSRFVWKSRGNSAPAPRCHANSTSSRCEKEAFVRDFLQKWKLKMWKRRFRARRPSKSQTCLCHKEALGAHTTACATLSFCDPPGTLSTSGHLRPYSNNIVPATMAPNPV